MLARTFWLIPLFAVAAIIPLQADGQQGKKEPIDDPAWLRTELEAIRLKHKVPAISASLVIDSRVVAASAVGVRKLGDPTPVTREDR